MEEQQLATESPPSQSLLMSSGGGGNGDGGSSLLLRNYNISEEDELKMLNFPPTREDLSTAIPLTVIFALLLVTGCIGNLCTAIVIARPKNKYMHTATNYYLFSLAMSDFLFLILGLPQEMYTLWQRYPYAFGEGFCIIRGYLSEASTYASILTISAFTMERYVAICHPLWAHTMSQLPRAITSILIIWIVSAICAIPPAAELGIIMQKGPVTNRTLSETAQCATKRTIYENMFAISAIVFFIVPMIIVTVLYILIALELRRSSKMNAAISKQTSSSNHLHQHHHHHHNHHHQHNHHHHHNHHHQHHHHQHNYNHLANHHHHSEKYHNNQRKLEQSSATNLFIAPPPTLSHVKNQHHKRQGSRANLTSLMSPSSVHQHHHNSDLLPASQVSSNTTNQQTDEQVMVQMVPSAADSNTKSGQSLMANLMSQRPQSAIGNEQSSGVAEFAKGAGRSSACSDKRNASPLWQFEPSTGCPHCCSGSRSTGNRALGNLKLAASNSLQPATAATPATAPLLKPETPDSAATTTVLCRTHSPLSYHESLLERRTTASPALPNLAQQRQFCRHAHQQQKHPNGFAMGANSGYLLPHQHSSGHARRSTAASGKKSVIRMLVAVVVSFFICWVPFHAQRLLAAYLVKQEDRAPWLLDLYLKLTYISGVMYYLSSTINPLLYQLMSAKFRLAFKETFNCSLLKCAFFMRSKASASPSNSLREPQHQHHHHQYQVRRSTCDCAICSAADYDSANGAGGATTCSTWATCSPPLCCVQQQQQQQQVGVLARLRGQLHSSLISIFRTSSSPDNNNGNATSTAVDTTCLHCTSSGQQPAGRSNANLIRHSSSCASTPLLLEPEVGVAPPCAPFRAHSLLKFVRSATPLSPTTAAVAAASTTQLCLTRLSSREEEESSVVVMNATNGGEDKETNNNHQSVSDKDKRQDRPEATETTSLAALIRPVEHQGNNCDATDLRDNNSANGSLIIMTSDSNASSSQSSSPEQHTTATAVSDATQSRPLHPEAARLTVRGKRLRRQSAHQQPASSCTAAATRRKSSSSSAYAPATSGAPGATMAAAATMQQQQLNLRRQLSVQSDSQASSLDKKLSVSTTTSAIDCGSYTTTDSSVLLMQPLSREHSMSDNDDYLNNNNRHHRVDHNYQLDDVELNNDDQDDDDDDGPSSEPSTTVINCKIPTQKQQQQQQQQLKAVVVVKTVAEQQLQRSLNGESTQKGDLKDSKQQQQQQLTCR